MEKNNCLPYQFAPGTSSGHAYFGAGNLDWIFGELHKLERDERLAALRRVGLIVSLRSDGTLGPEWTVAESATAGYLQLGSSGTRQTFVDAEGYLVSTAGAYTPRTLVAPRTLSPLVPNDGVWYTVVLRRGWTHYEPGTLTFNGTINVTGSGTKFTRYAGSVGEFTVSGSYIRIDAADSAALAGEYQIDTVTSDTALTLTTAAPGAAAGIPYTMVAQYTATIPADKGNHNFLEPVLALVARTREPSGNDIILCDIQRSAGVITTIERRHQSLAIPKESIKNSSHLAPLMEFSSAKVASLSQEPVVGVAQDTVNGIGVVRGDYDTTLGEQILVVWGEAATTINSARFRVETGGMAATVLVTISGEQPCLVEIPVGGGDFRHACFYIDSAVLYARYTTDGGASWSGANLIWDPTAVDPADTLAHPFALLLLNGRLVVLAEYYDDSAGTTHIHAVYSDDYGTTWQTNASAGWDVSGIGGAYPGAAQDPVTKNILHAFEATALGLQCELYANAGFPVTVSTVSSINYDSLLSTGSEGDPAVWADPGGNFHILESDSNPGNTTGYLTQATILSNDQSGSTALKPGDRRILFQLATALGGSFRRAAPAFTQSRSGLVWAAYIERGATDVIYLTPFTCVALPQYPQIS